MKISYYLDSDAFDNSSVSTHYALYPLTSTRAGLRPCVTVNPVGEALVEPVNYV